MPSLNQWSHSISTYAVWKLLRNTLLKKFLLILWEFPATNLDQIHLISPNSSQIIPHLSIHPNPISCVCVCAHACVHACMWCACVYVCTHAHQFTWVQFVLADYSWESFHWRANFAFPVGSQIPVDAQPGLGLPVLFPSSMPGFCLAEFVWVLWMMSSSRWVPMCSCSSLSRKSSTTSVSQSVPSPFCLDCWTLRGGYYIHAPF